MINPNIKKLFPEKTDNEILYAVYHPCEDCADKYEACCETACVLGRLLKMFTENQVQINNNEKDNDDYYEAIRESLGNNWW